MMRTTLDITPGLVEKVVEITGEKSKGRAVDRAMEDFIRRDQIEKLIALAGKIEFEGDWEERHERDFALEREHRQGWQ